MRVNNQSQNIYRLIERSVSSSPFILAAIAVINGLTAVLGLVIGAVIDQPVIGRIYGQSGCSRCNSQLDYRPVYEINVIANRVGKLNSLYT